MRTAYVPGRWLVFRYDIELPPPNAVTTERLSVVAVVLAGGRPSPPLAWAEC